MIDIKDKDKDILDSQKIKKYITEYSRPIITRITIGKVALLNSGKLFFFGINEEKRPGGIRVSKYPFPESDNANEKDKNQDKEKRDFPVLELLSHNKPLTRIKISSDDSYIFTAG